MHSEFQVRLLVAKNIVSLILGGLTYIVYQSAVASLCPTPEITAQCLDVSYRTIVLFRMFAPILGYSFMMFGVTRGPLKGLFDTFKVHLQDESPIADL